jgi:hypothetical protein
MEILYYILIIKMKSILLFVVFVFAINAQYFQKLMIRSLSNSTTVIKMNPSKDVIVEGNEYGEINFYNTNGALLSRKTKTHSFSIVDI